MSLLIIAERPTRHDPAMIEAQEFHFTIYTDMPTQHFPRNPPMGPTLFLGMGEDPHDDETDQEIDLDVDVEESDDEDELEDHEDPLHLHKTDLLSKLKHYLTHLPRQPTLSVTEGVESSGVSILAYPNNEPIFVTVSSPSPISHTTTTPLPATSTHRSATKKHRKSQRATSTTRSASKPSRKAHPKNSY